MVTTTYLSLQYIQFQLLPSLYFYSNSISKLIFIKYMYLDKKAKTLSILCRFHQSATSISERGPCVGSHFNLSRHNSDISRELGLV